MNKLKVKHYKKGVLVVSVALTGIFIIILLATQQLTKDVPLSAGLLDLGPGERIVLVTDTDQNSDEYFQGVGYSLFADMRYRYHSYDEQIGSYVFNNVEEGNYSIWVTYGKHANYIRYYLASSMPLTIDNSLETVEHTIDLKSDWDAHANDPDFQDHWMRVGDGTVFVMGDDTLTVSFSNKGSEGTHFPMLGHVKIRYEGGGGSSSSVQTGECGNGIVDPGEECDDGNTTIGDGCGGLCNEENDIIKDDDPYGRFTYVSEYSRVNEHCDNLGYGGHTGCQFYTGTYKGLNSNGESFTIEAWVEYYSEPIKAEEFAETIVPDQNEGNFAEVSSLNSNNYYMNGNKIFGSHLLSNYRHYKWYKGHRIYRVLFYNIPESDTTYYDERGFFGGMRLYDNDAFDDTLFHAYIIGSGSDVEYDSQVCGNEIIERYKAPIELCDDGNMENEDRCSDSCKVEYCGDGILQIGLGEECDDENTQDNDSCNSECRVDLEARVRAVIAEQWASGNNNYLEWEDFTETLYEIWEFNMGRGYYGSHPFDFDSSGFIDENELSTVESALSMADPSIIDPLYEIIFEEIMDYSDIFPQTLRINWERNKDIHSEWIKILTDQIPQRDWFDLDSDGTVTQSDFERFVHAMGMLWNHYLVYADNNISECSMN